MSLPPYIAKIDATIDADIAVELEAAMSEISRLDSTHGTHLAALRTLLLRTESVVAGPDGDGATRRAATPASASAETVGTTCRPGHGAKLLPFDAP
ncbi:hypothetical protein B8W66_19270 [Mycobacterium decipiens]|uniref:Uncharacterized protein n=1 Tax=Mycobacterium decipiens TaxID=1430326 RepID=A0A1X2LQS3_9MYCO|nr:hypothetical protein B8W66_19270 [Mycobacterium decipiens]